MRRWKDKIMLTSPYKRPIPAPKTKTGRKTPEGTGKVREIIENTNWKVNIFMKLRNTYMKNKK